MPTNNGNVQELAYDHNGLFNYYTPEEYKKIKVAICTCKLAVPVQSSTAGLAAKGQTSVRFCGIPRITFNPFTRNADDCLM
jgi:hypothetical protein